MVDEPNLARLKAMSLALGHLTDELCVVGGCAAGLLITDPGSSPVRPTVDVDMIVEAVQYVEYHHFCERLRQRGFSQSAASGGPICRWHRDELILDIMPLDESVLGFSNRWYRSAFEARKTVDLQGDRRIHHIDAPHFLATKLTAFENRGGGDYVTSHDLEDLVRVVDGRREIEEELAWSSKELHTYVAGGIRKLRADRFFMEALPGYFQEDPGRARLVGKRLESLSTVAEPSDRENPDRENSDG